MQWERFSNIDFESAVGPTPLGVPVPPGSLLDRPALGEGRGVSELEGVGGVRTGRSSYGLIRKQGQLARAHQEPGTLDWVRWVPLGMRGEGGEEATIHPQ